MAKSHTSSHNLKKIKLCLCIIGNAPNVGKGGVQEFLIVYHHKENAPKEIFTYG
jgi:hypothetical protein